MGLAPALFAAYTFTRLIVGNEYRDLPGNVEVFFPLVLAVFLLAGVVSVAAWVAAAATPLRPRHPAPTASRGRCC